MLPSLPLCVLSTESLPAPANKKHTQRDNRTEEEGKPSKASALFFLVTLALSLSLFLFQSPPSRARFDVSRLGRESALSSEFLSRRPLSPSLFLSLLLILCVCVYIHTYIYVDTHTQPLSRSRPSAITRRGCICVRRACVQGCCKRGIQG